MHSDLRRDGWKDDDESYENIFDGYFGKGGGGGELAVEPTTVREWLCTETLPLRPLLLPPGRARDEGETVADG